MQCQNELGQAIGAPVKNWVEALPPTRSEIAGQFCNIVPLDVKAHAKSLFDAFAKDTEHKSWTYLPYGPFATFAEFEKWLIKTAANQDPFFYSIVDNNTQVVVGVASYLRINQQQGVIEVGHIHFSPALQQTPMATEAMFLMMKHVFEDLGYRRYEWKCDSLNEKSRKAALRLGFTFEGIFRQATMYKGRNRDTAWYAMLDKQWPSIKQAFLLWLDPTNFDSDGKQRQRLWDFLLG